jgi:hypothetical protein
MRPITRLRREYILRRPVVRSLARKLTAFDNRVKIVNAKLNRRMKAEKLKLLRKRSRELKAERSDIRYEYLRYKGEFDKLVHDIHVLEIQEKIGSNPRIVIKAVEKPKPKPIKFRPPDEPTEQELAKRMEDERKAMQDLYG